MKKLLSVTISIALLLTCLSLTAAADWMDNWIDIDINNATAPVPTEGWESHPQGTELIVPIDIFSNTGVSLIIATLEYDTDAFILVKAENGIVLEDMDQGVNLMWSSDNDSTATGRLVTLTFKIADNATPKDYTIGLKVRECYNSAGEKVGACIYTANNVSVSKKNDIDMNGEITKKDVSAILNYIVNKNVEVNEKAADVNGDGKVTVVDAIELMLTLAAKSTP